MHVVDHEIMIYNLCESPKRELFACNFTKVDLFSPSDLVSAFAVLRMCTIFQFRLILLTLVERNKEGIQSL